MLDISCANIWQSQILILSKTLSRRGNDSLHIKGYMVKIAFLVTLELSIFVIQPFEQSLKRLKTWALTVICFKHDRLKIFIKVRFVSGLLYILYQKHK